MRKIYLTLVLMTTVLWAGAQMSQINIGGQEANTLSKADMAKKAAAVRKYIKNRDLQTKTVKSRWYNFAFAIDDQLGNIATAAANNLWPDTTILVEYSGGTFSGPWIHALGECINPTSDWFDPSDPNDLDINAYMPYTIDSIGFYCIYYRPDSSNTAVDTLQVQILIDGDGNYYWEQGQSPWVMSDYGTDTLWFKGIKHDPLSFTTTDPNYQTFKFPLNPGDENDTIPGTGGLNYYAFPLGVQVPAGQTFVATVAFIPGFSWNANVDTISQFNHMRFISNEENGDGGGSGTLPSYTKRDWNASYINFDNWMYNPNSSHYAISYVFVAAYAYEHHWIEFKLSADQTGISTAKVSNLSVGQNQPNPFHGTTTINYNLAAKANVSITVYNVAGAKVMEINRGVQAAGAHRAELNASSLNAGVYYYTVEAGNDRITRKMVVY